MSDIVYVQPNDTVNTIHGEVENPKHQSPQDATEPKALIDLSEDEQLAVVIARSIAEQKEKERSAKRKDTEIPEAVNDNKRNKLVSDVNETSAPPKQDEEAPATLDCVIQVCVVPTSPRLTLVKIRDNNGNTLKKSFNSQQSLQTVYDWVRQTSNCDDFALMRPFPRKVFTTAMLHMSLQQCDLVPSAVLVMTMNKDGMK